MERYKYGITEILVRTRILNTYLTRVEIRKPNLRFLNCAS